LILQKLHGKTIVWSLKIYILKVDSAKLSQYRKWLSIIVCVLILTKVDKVVATTHIVSMKDGKEIKNPILMH
jgi:hypothetical protein